MRSIGLAGTADAGPPSATQRTGESAAVAVTDRIVTENALLSRVPGFVRERAELRIRITFVSREHDAKL